MYSTRTAFSLRVLHASLLALAAFFFAPPYHRLAAEEILRFRFDSLKRWEKLAIPGIDTASKYSIVSDTSGNRILQAKSFASASGLVSKIEFDPHTRPKLCWKWKVENVYEKGNALKKSGDDYPLRLFVVFPYDPDSVSLWQNARYESAKLLYGQYPPGRSLNYIWSNRPQARTRFRSAYTDMAELIIIQNGSENIGKWMTEEVDIIADYRKAFGKSAPHKARLAIMNDSDNTGEASTSYVDFIELGEQTSCTSAKHTQ